MFTCLGKIGTVWCLICLVDGYSIWNWGYDSMVEEPTFGEKIWYSVVGSSYVEANSEYMCVVTIAGDTSENTDVTVEVKGVDNNSTNLFSASETVTVETSSTRIVRLQVRELDANISRFMLYVKGEGGLNFTDSEPLYPVNKRVSLLVQTDRAVYKPGANIHIRVLVLDSQLRPILSAPLHVYIKDKEGNRVKEWREAKSQDGVWTAELQLSDYPPLGDWAICVSALGTTAVKLFLVDEYVLPKFEVSISAPQHWLITNDIIPIRLSAKYTHGGGVKGEATITAKASQTEVKVVPIDGEAVVEFDLRHVKNDKRSDNLFFEVIVKEGATGKLMNSTASVKLHHHPVLIEFIKSSDEFIPGRNFTVHLKVTQYDGTPVYGSECTTVCIHLSSEPRESYEKNFELKQISRIPPNGLIKINGTPLPDSSVFYIKAKCGETEATKVLRTLDYDNKIILNLITQQMKVNAEVEVEISVTQEIPNVHYIIMGRRGLVAAGSLNVTDQNSSVYLKFKATPSMAPSSKLVVYCIKEGLAVASKSMKLIFSPHFDLDNFVNIESNSSVGEPGQSVALTIKTKPNSLVGLLAVDQSSLLLKQGNDITMSSVIEELNSYLPNTIPRSPQVFKRKNPDFKNAGALILTNAWQEYRWHPRHWHSHYRHGFAYSSGTFGMGRLDSGVFSRGVANNRERPGIERWESGVFSGDYDDTLYDSAPPVSLPQPKLRSKFPETWFWRNVHTNEEGQVSLNETLPDTMTSWVISGFSLNSVDGLGLVKQPTNIKVFRPFFVTVDLPYSIIRGEAVSIPVLVFNYMDTEVTSDISLLNDAEQFVFESTTDSVSNKPEKELLRKERVRIGPNSVGKVSFTITPTQVGYIAIKVLAQCDVAADLIERQLLVKAEGETQYKNIALLIDLRTENTHEETVFIDVPHNVVPGSAHLEVSAIGDILGTSMQNLDKLVRMPYGCGEQNMLKFVPNILVLDYFKKSGLDIPAGMEEKCLKYMNTGYQQELTYKHPDGSYSAFGKSDTSGSTWLTAFVLKSFLSAMPYMEIDKKIISEGLSWLASKQATDGSFREVGRIWQKDMQGGSADGLGLTSFSLLPFLMLEDKEQYSSTIDKGVAYIENQLDSITNDSYSLAISSYALHLADSPLKDKAFNLLNDNAHTTRTKMWWKRTPKMSDSHNPFALKPNSLDIEMTAYALLSVLQLDLVKPSLDITTWLLSQQNSNGGFASTQDTVVALTALSQQAAKLSSKDSDITINFSTDKDFSKDIQVNSNNRLVLQTVEIGDNGEKAVMMKASGQGLAIVQVSHRYNIYEKEVSPIFVISKPIIPDSERNQLLLEICSSFMSDEDESSNMVVMEINLPSGYVVDQDSISSLNQDDSVMRTEFKHSDTHVDLYFDKMTRDVICPKVVAMKKYNVENYKPVAISVYDYYDQSRRATIFYSLPEQT